MTTDDVPLGAAYRAVRAIRAQDDGPWPGVLVRTAAGASHVLVDADVLGPDWSGWAAEADGHVLAPLDIARRPRGHDVVLPVCVERLEDFVRRREARLRLTSGEAVTLAVSLLRGCAQIAATPETTGEWWLDDAGRPVLVTDAAPRRALDATAGVLQQVSVDPPMQRTWDVALRAVSAERVSVRELASAEDALFAVADAEPLSTVSLGPRPAADSLSPDRHRAAGDRPATAHEPAPRSVWHTLVRGLDDELADTVSRATTSVWRRLRPSTRPRTGSRRAPWLVGGTVAAAVLAGGALWPSASGTATEDHPTTAHSPSPATGATPAEGNDAIMPTADAPEGGGDDAEDAQAGAGAPGDGSATEGPAPAGGAADLAAIASGLLDARLACGAAADCLAAVVVAPAAIAPGAVDLDAGERTVTMLDDFGDLAVLRVDAADAARVSQLIVMLRQDEKWLLRDVRDVAQQP